MLSVKSVTLVLLILQTAAASKEGGIRGGAKDNKNDGSRVLQGNSFAAWDDACVSEAASLDGCIRNNVLGMNVGNAQDDCKSCIVAASLSSFNPSYALNNCVYSLCLECRDPVRDYSRCGILLTSEDTNTGSTTNSTISNTANPNTKAPVESDPPMTSRPVSPSLAPMTGQPVATPRPTFASPQTSAPVSTTVDTTSMTDADCSMMQTPLKQCIYSHGANFYMCDSCMLSAKSQLSINFLSGCLDFGMCPSGCTDNVMELGSCRIAVETKKRSAAAGNN